jgi:hypothetical protein
LKHKELHRKCNSFFFCLRTPCEHRSQSQTSHEHREIPRARFWCSQNTQSSSSGNYYRPSISFFQFHLSFWGAKPHFGVRKWCSQGVLPGYICNTSKLLLNNDPMSSTCVALAN